jgi:hypothetical protein
MIFHCSVLGYGRYYENKKKPYKKKERNQLKEIKKNFWPGDPLIQ